MTAPTGRTRLSALVVNYNSGQFALRCIESLIAIWSLDGRDPNDLEIVVVDNASPTDQNEHLRHIEELGVLVDRSSENLGYARGMNRAYSHTRGGSRDVVAILNPDLFFLPGSVDALMDALQDPGVGLVDPKVSIEPGRELLLPRNPLPSLFEHVWMSLSHRFSFVGRRYARHRLATDVPWLESVTPYETDMLSGCCMFLRRDTIAQLGGEPMDGIFPLYYEDTDLCRRVSALGLRLLHLGNAAVLHYWSRSAGIGAQFEGEPLRRYDISQAIYFRRYYGAIGGRLAKYFTSKGRKWAQRHTGAVHEFKDLGVCHEPPLLEMEGDGPFLLESNFSPNFLLSAGTLGEGRSFQYSAQAWQWIFSARLFVRALDRRTLKLRGAWTFERAGAVRHHGLTVDETLGDEVAALVRPLKRADVPAGNVHA